MQRSLRILPLILLWLVIMAGMLLVLLYGALTLAPQVLLVLAMVLITWMALSEVRDRRNHSLDGWTRIPPHAGL